MMIYLTHRPSALPAALVSLATAAARPTGPALPAVGVLGTAQVHQVQSQIERAEVERVTAEPAPAARVRTLVRTEGFGVIGGTGADLVASKKCMNVRGVPPRGKPV